MQQEEKTPRTLSSKSELSQKSEEGLFQQHFETGQKVNISDAAILSAYNVHEGLDKHIAGVELPKGPRASFIEFKEDGPYLNGARIDGITGMSIDSKVGDLTRVDVKLVAKVHGLDDIKQGYSF